MQPRLFLATIVDPALAFMAAVVPTIGVSDEARLETLAIAGQESDWSARRQGGGGPARSGAGEVIAKCPNELRAVCTALVIPFDLATIFDLMAWNDTLACCMARLLLWQDPAPLPRFGHEQPAWEYYRRNWRPGRPRPEKWPDCYALAAAAVEAEILLPPSA
jgi:hypothetical protein